MAWPHPFFIHNQISDWRSVAPSTPMSVPQAYVTSYITTEDITVKDDILVVAENRDKN